MGENQPRYCADRSPDEYSMKAGVIKEITYPTGGKTEFIFEANRATNVYSDDPSENITGGLRIHQIINRSSISSQPEIKTYKYVRGGSTETIDYTQFIYSNHTYELYDWAVVCGGGIGYDPRKRDYPVIVMKDSPLTPLIGWGNSPVFYRDVIEYIGTEANNKGWTEYEYIPSDLNYSACIHEGMNIPLCFSNALDCDRGLVQPLLHKETEYDNSGQILRETTNDYGVKKVSSFITGVRISNPVTYKPGYEYYMTGYPSNSPGYMQLYHQKLGYFNSWAYRDVYTLDSTTIIEKINGSDIKQTTLYNYDEQLRILEPVSTDMKNSSGESLVTKIKFPFNFSTGIYPTMTTLNMLSYNVQTEKYKNNSFIDKFIYNYKYWDIGGYAIENIMRQNYNQTSPETFLIYNNYNAKGNPVYITQYDVNKIVYLWGYNHQYLIAEIKNATYSDVSSALVGITPEQLSASTIPDMSKVEALRQSSTLSKAQITTYTYKPLVGILTQTDPRGVTTYYNYDTFNRLQWIKDVNEKLIQSFDYNYKQ